MALRNGSGEIDPRFNVIAICERFGWTYAQYEDAQLNSPQWFLELLGVKLEAEAIHQAFESQKVKDSK